MEVRVGRFSRRVRSSGTRNSCSASDGDVTTRSAPGAKPVIWRYKLLAGDAADFYDFAPDAANRSGLFPDARGSVRVTMRIESRRGEKYERRDHDAHRPERSGTEVAARAVGRW